MKMGKSACPSLVLGQGIPRNRGSRCFLSEYTLSTLELVADGASAQTSSLLQVFVSISGLVLVRHPYHCEPAFAKLEGTREGRVNSSVIKIHFRPSCCVADTSADYTLKKHMSYPDLSSARPYYTLHQASRENSGTSTIRKVDYAPSLTMLGV